MLVFLKNLIRDVFKRNSRQSQRAEYGHYYLDSTGNFGALVQQASFAMRMYQACAFERGHGTHCHRVLQLVIKLSLTAAQIVLTVTCTAFGILAATVRARSSLRALAAIEVNEHGVKRSAVAI
jgi:hypothetical protein